VVLADDASDVYIERLFLVAAVPEVVLEQFQPLRQLRRAGIEDVVSLERALRQRVVLVSAEAGAGKSAAFQRHRFPRMERRWVVRFDWNDGRVLQSLRRSAAGDAPGEPSTRFSSAFSLNAIHI